jgi:hypothetical protein
MTITPREDVTAPPAFGPKLTETQHADLDRRLGALLGALSSTTFAPDTHLDLVRQARQVLDDHPSLSGQKRVSWEGCLSSPDRRHPDRFKVQLSFGQFGRVDIFPVWEAMHAAFFEICRYVFVKDKQTTTQADLTARKIAEYLELRGCLPDEATAQEREGLIAPNTLRWHGVEVSLTTDQYKLIQLLWGSGPPFKPVKKEHIVNSMYHRGRTARVQDPARALKELRSRTDLAFVSAKARLIIDNTNGHYMLTPLQ